MTTQTMQRSMRVNQRQRMQQRCQSPMEPSDDTRSHHEMVFEERVRNGVRATTPKDEQWRAREEIHPSEPIGPRKRNHEMKPSQHGLVLTGPRRGDNEMTPSQHGLVLTTASIICDEYNGANDVLGSDGTRASPSSRD